MLGTCAGDLVVGVDLIVRSVVGTWGAFLGLGHHRGWPREPWVSVTVGVAEGPSEILTRLGKIYFQANTTSVRELGLKLGKPRKPWGLQNWATPGRARQSTDKRTFCC